MIIPVLKDNWRVEFGGDLCTLGDSAPAALNEPCGATVTLFFLTGFEISHAVELLYQCGAVRTQCLPVKKAPLPLVL